MPDKKECGNCIYIGETHVKKSRVKHGCYYYPPKSSGIRPSVEKKDVACHHFIVKKV